MTSAQRQSKFFPELDYLDSKKARRAVYRKALRRIFKSPRFWLIGVLYLTILPSVFLTLLYVVRRWTSISIPPAAFGGMVGGIIGGTFMSAIQYVFRYPIRRCMREQLVERGVPICVKCGYDLRGQTEPRCPECGESFDPELLREDQAGDLARADTAQESISDTE